MSQTANRILRNSVYLYARMGITTFISLYTTRLILNTLGASDYGIFNIVGGAIAMMGFLNVSLASATQRFMSFYEGVGNKEKQKRIFNVSIILHFCIAIIVCFLLLGAGYFFFNGFLNIPIDRLNAAKIVYGGLIVSTAFTIINVPYDAVLNAHENMKYYAIVGIFESLLKLCVAFACVYTSRDKLIIYGLLMSCIPLITMTIMKLYCHRKYEECVISPKQYYSRDVLKEMTDFAGWNLLASIVVVVSNHGIGIVMNMFFGTIVNAAQGVAAQLSGQLQAVTTTMSKAINPVLTKKAGKGLQQNLIIASCTSSKILFFLSSLICIPSIVTMPTLMKLWLGDVPEYAPFFCQSLLIVALCEQITGGLYSTILAKGDIKEVMIVKSCIRALYLPLIYILFKIGFSPIWAYITQIIIQGIINAMIINIYYAHKKAGISSSYYMKQVFIPAVSVVLFVLLIATTLAPIWNGIYKFFIVSTLTAIILIPIIYIFGFNKYEKNLVKQILKKTNKHGSIS